MLANVSAVDRDRNESGCGRGTNSVRLSHRRDRGARRLGSGCSRERAEIEPDPEERRRLLNFVVVGDGATGVELVGVFAELARHALATDFHTIDPRSAWIVLVEAGPRVLSQFDESPSRSAQQALERLGAEVRVGTEVTGCDELGISLGSERLDSRTVIWAAGVEASPAGRWLGAEIDHAGRIKVGPDLSRPGRPHIFAIGDTASCVGADGRPLRRRPRCQTTRGLPGAPHLLRNAGHDRAQPRGGGDGRRQDQRLSSLALVVLRHIYFLIGFRNCLIVMLNWVWKFITFQRGARLMEAPPAGDGRH